jgi:hypothetical protein
MSADASIDLELNAKQLYSELQVAERKYTQGMDRIGKSTGTAGGHVEGLTVRTRAAGRQIHNFAQDMANGADAATLLQDGLMGVGKSLGLSLGALAGIGIVAVVAVEVGKMIKEFKALNAEIDKLTAPRVSADFQSLTELEGHLKSVSGALEKVRKQQSDLEGNGKHGRGSQMLQGIADWFMGQGYGTGAIADQRRKQIGDLSESGSRDRGDMAEKFQGRMRDRESALGGEPDFISKAKKFQSEANEKSHATQEAVIELMAELEMNFKELAATVADKRRNRVQQTLGELAAIPEVATSGDSYERWQAGQKARQAQAWDAYGESRRQAGDMSGAQDALNHSTDIKRSIAGLKDSEKDMKGEFKGALEEAQILKEIRDAAKGGLVNR